MGLPPATPAPSRFLVSKRLSTQQSQNQTPNQHASGPPQFHATPRFASTSTPRPSTTQPGHAFATPTLAIKPRIARTRSTQDIIDDSSPTFVEEDSPAAPPASCNARPEPIDFEFGSSLIPESQSPDQFENGRSPKRRRISIASSEPDTEQIARSSQELEDADVESLPDAVDDHILSYHSELNIIDDDLEAENDLHDRNPPISPTPSIPPSSPPSSSLHDEQEEHENPKPKPTTKPSFHPAPRFKPADAPDPNHPGPNDPYPAADIFSPQRRGGAKYLAGGLAAELRDWLVDVKEGGVDGEGGEGQGGGILSGVLSSSGSGSAGGVRVVVDGVCRGGPGMTLVSGRVMAGGGDMGTSVGVRVILAGQGNVEGLGRPGRGRRDGTGNRGLVAPGAVVAVASPAWEVELDGQWAVAYRWEVVEGRDDDG